MLNSTSEKRQLKTKFVSDDKTLLGSIQMDNWDFEDATIGIYTTDQLLRLLGVVDEDIKVSISKSGDKALSMKVSDSVTSVNYMLSDSSIINEPPPLQNTPEFELKIDVKPSDCIISKAFSSAKYRFTAGV